MERGTALSDEEIRAKLAAVDEISYLPVAAQIWCKNGFFLEKAVCYATFHSLPEWKITTIAKNFEMIFGRKIASGCSFSDAFRQIFDYCN